ncbi:hypothetical protein [Catenuloplanes japonicus]|uniref:hypothetical protein n=1 Tax=Catenuloplanes japonicus TaxID=33876 RepID=UPI000526E0D0|nr:hypothetical protein [Catenuloplanes japonicus]
MSSFDDQVRAAQEAEEAARQSSSAAQRRTADENAAAEAEVVGAARLLAEALADLDIPVDVTVEFRRRFMRKKFFGGYASEEEVFHVFDGWLFGETRHDWTDPDTGRSTHTMSGRILAVDGQAHQFFQKGYGWSADGRSVLHVDQPWGTNVLDAPLVPGNAAGYREALADLVRLAVKHRVDPARLRPPAASGPVPAIDVDEIRRLAREQLQRRGLSPRTAWVLDFEEALRAALLPRAELFVTIMAAAGFPGLYDKRERSAETGSRAWTIGAYDSITSIGSYVDDNWVAHTVDSTHPVFLALDTSSAFHTARAVEDWQSIGVAGAPPDRTIVVDGEIDTPSALGEVGVRRYAEDTSAADSAAEFAVACDRRMLLLLCANDLTFPDRDLSRVTWDESESRVLRSMRGR